MDIHSSRTSAPEMRFHVAVLMGRNFLTPRHPDVRVMCTRNHVRTEEFMLSLICFELNWGSLEPLHLKSGHPKMVFSCAWGCIDTAYPCLDNPFLAEML